MQYTPNYNLITVEGTDVVNPLVQMNPNFTDIDAAMFANKQAVIGSAVENTSGTVHNITRLNPDSNYFRFTATSNWNAGDSMTLDGQSVSVFLTDGTTPVTGSYVINSEVFGMLSGTRVTLYLSNPLANSIGNVADLDTNDKSSIVNAINEIVDSGTLTEIWNRTVVGPFSAQTITFANDGYDAILVELGDDDLASKKLVMCEIGTTAKPTDLYIAVVAGYIYEVFRPFSVSLSGNNIEVSFTDCNLYQLTALGTAPSQSTDNTKLVPIRIIGIKHRS